MSERFFVTGGSLRGDAPSYVERAADDELFGALGRGEFCYVLTSRQMGKSSLMVRTAARLREAGHRVVVLDLTAIGQNVTPEQWYEGLLMRMGEQLGLEDELDDFWQAHARLGPLQRFMRAVREAIPAAAPSLALSGSPPQPEAASLLLCIDEIDTVRSLPFSTDEFFAAIRECYNRRTEEPEYERLTFCLLGVATPSDLIRDTRLTPFNIGRRIELGDFTEGEAQRLGVGLLHPGGTETRRGREEEEKRQAAAILKRVLYWTGGHPYLTQRLCRAVAADAQAREPGDVDRHCEALFLSAQARERDDNLLFVRERLLRSEADLAGLLELYGRVREGRRVPPDDTNPLLDGLRLSGIVRLRTSRAPVRSWRRARTGFEVRNRIYTRVFDGHWVMQHMPDAQLRREKAAFRRGALRTVTVAAALLAVMGGLTGWAVDSRHIARARAEEARRDRDTARTAQREERRQRLAAEAAAERERRSADAARRATREAREAGRRADEQAARARRAAAGERAQRLVADARQQKYRRILYIADMNAAERAWADGQVARHRELVRAHGAPARGEEELRGFEWYYSRGLARRVLLSTPYFATLSPDAGVLIMITGEGKLGIVDVAAGTLIRSLSPPGGELHAWESSRDGRLLLLAGEKQVGVWATHTGREVLRLRHLRAPFTAATFSPDGRRLVVMTGDSSLRLWDTVSGQRVPGFNASATGSAELSFAPAGRRLVLLGQERVRVLDAATGREVLGFSSAGKYLAELQFTPDGTRMVTAAWSKDRQGTPIGAGVVKVWDSASGSEVLSFSITEFSVSKPILSGGGRFLMVVNQASEGQPAPAGAGGEAHVWDLTNGNAHRSFPVAPTGPYDCRFSPGERRLAVLDRRSFRVWDAATGGQVIGLTRTGQRTDPAGGTEFSALDFEFAFSPDGAHLVTEEGSTMRLWDAVSGREVFSAAGAQDAIFSPDGTSLAALDSGTVSVWDTGTGRKEIDLPAVGEFSELKFLPDSRRLLTREENGTARLWDLGSRGAKRESLESLLSLRVRGTLSDVAFSRDGKRMLVQESIFREGSFADEPSQLWDLSGPPNPRILAGTGQDVLSIAFSPNSRLLATAGDDGMVRLWDPHTGSALRTLKTEGSYAFTVCFSPNGKQLACATYGGGARVWDTATGRLLLTLKGHSGPVTSVTFSPDGRCLATGSDDHTIRIWDEAGRLVQIMRGHQGPVNSVVFAADGRRVASGSNDQTLRVWDWRTGHQLKVLRGHRDSVRSVAFSPDGRRLASAERTGAGKIWDVTAGKEILTLKGRVTSLFTLQFSPDGLRLATGAAGDTVKLWDVRSGREVLTLDGPGDIVTAAAFSPDGTMIAASARDGLVRLWRAPRK